MAVLGAPFSGGQVKKYTFLKKKNPNFRLIKWNDQRSLHHHQHITRELFCEQKRRGVEHGPKVIRDAGLIDRLSALGKAAQLRNSVQLHVWAGFI